MDCKYVSFCKLTYAMTNVMKENNTCLLHFSLKQHVLYVQSFSEAIQR